MKGDDVDIDIPEGRYDIEVRVIFNPRKPGLYLGGNRTILLSEYEIKDLTITDKERRWNILFDIDLVLWVAEFFITLPSPWHAIYLILSNGFFIIWLLRLWIIRKEYFKLVG